VAAERGTTYVLIGEPRSARGLRRLGVSLPERLLERMPGVDIRIVADRTKRGAQEVES
jgi:two-component system sensor histidine kinase KdpD